MDNIFDVLGFKDIEYGNIQSVDEMTILPILGEDKTKHLSDPSNIKFERTSSYGTMEFSNDDPDEGNFGIVPDNTMVLSNYGAQDHAMSETGVMISSTRVSYENACCVQSSQGGLLSGNKENTFNILPLNLRASTLSASFRKEKSYDKLWDSIGNWLETIPGIQHDNQHLEYFFKPFAKELEDFASEFEPVEHQIGSAIFFNEKIVGIELMPSVRYWDYYWKWLVRGCYGAELLRLKKSGKITPSRIIPKLTSGDVADEMTQFMSNLKAVTIKKTEEVPIARTINSAKSYGATLSSELVHFGTQYGGDVLLENKKPVYVSIITK